jgi:Na+/H+-dicarboxylate symporter
VPTGYTFNTDGSSLYMTLAALFVAQATNTHLTIGRQLTLFAVAVLTSKNASGVQGASFIALVATLQVIPTIPVAGMALILGIDRFMSMFRATVNVIGMPWPPWYWRYGRRNSTPRRCGRIWNWGLPPPCRWRRKQINSGLR